MEKKIEDVFEKYFLEVNDQENRNKMKAEFEPIIGFPLEDHTSTEMVDQGLFCFKGLNPKTNRTLVIKLEKS